MARGSTNRFVEFKNSHLQQSRIYKRDLETHQVFRICPPCSVNVEKSMHVAIPECCVWFEQMLMYWYVRVCMT